MLDVEEIKDTAYKLDHLARAGTTYTKGHWFCLECNRILETEQSGHAPDCAVHALLQAVDDILDAMRMRAGG